MAILEEVKKRLAITDESNDDVLSGLIDDVIEYCVSAGVSRETMESAKAYGLITRGVSDLWSMASGEGKFSDVFNLRLVQLQYEKIVQSTGD